MNTNMLESAMGILALGFAIFPLATRSKQPAIAKSDGGHGCLDATRDVDVIRKWWAARPQANIGLATGPASGVWVLDVDMHDGKHGLESLGRLQAAHGDLPPTRLAFTPSGGLHYYFAWDEKRPVRGRTSKLAADLDTRGRGGYVVAPGSALEAGEYAWIEQRPVAVAPDWLMQMVVDVPAKAPPAAAPMRPTTTDEARAQAALSRLARWRIDNYEAWVEVGMSLASLGPRGLYLWDAWSRGSEKYKHGECERKWASFEPSGVTLASLHFWANSDSPRPIAQTARRSQGMNYGDIIAHGI